MNSRLPGLLLTSIAPVIGCFSSSPLQNSSPSGGRSGTNSGTDSAIPAKDAGSGIALIANNDGWLEVNPAGAVGAWWSTGDDFAPDGTPGAGPCTAAGFPVTACSTLMTPTPDMPFRPDPNGRGLCTSGTAAQVLVGGDGGLAWSAIWGNIVGFNLATSDPSAMPVVGTYDAPAHGITGFSFDIQGILPLGHLRVLVGTAENDTDSAYWDGAVDDLSPFNGPGRYEVRWTDIGGPLYLGGAAPPFDPTMIEWIAFHVVSRDAGPASYAFCINNVMLLLN